jgi:hypothetical protein
MSNETREQVLSVLFFDQAKRLANDPVRIQRLISELDLKLVSNIKIQKKEEKNDK